MLENQGVISRSGPLIGGQWSHIATGGLVRSEGSMHLCSKFHNKLQQVALDSDQIWTPTEYVPTLQK